VFDASGHLYTRLTPVEENMIPPAEHIAIRPQDLSRLDHEHIDLTASSDKNPASIPTEQPDQSEFMESTIGTNARYNNLDEMAPVPIPGELEFGESFIKFDEPKETQAEQQTESENPYEDVESKEAPTTDQDNQQIQDLYSAADEILRSEPGEETSQDEIDKHIDELLAFTRSLDKTGDLPDDTVDNNDDDLDIIDEIEIQPETSVKNTSPDDATAKPGKTLSDKQRDRSIDFDANNLGIESFTGEQSAFTDSMLGVKDPEPHIAFKQKDEQQAKPKAKPKQSVQPEPDDTDDFFDDSMSSKQTLPQEDDLPSIDQNIPLALRRSLEKAEKPDRSPWVTAGLSFALVILILGLLVQAVIFRSTELAHMSPAMQPVLTSLCDTLTCVYSGPVDVSKISLTNRDVRSHPTQKNALLISAAFVNQAGFNQPYPDILVKLSDLSGNIVANRRFTPEEYLDKMYTRFLLMESGTPVHITLPVLDPGDDAINFEFTFL
jgi:hypothetical protein